VLGKKVAHYLKKTLLPVGPMTPGNYENKKKEITSNNNPSLNNERKNNESIN
jgi:hypothetical protein